MCIHTNISCLPELCPEEQAYLLHLVIRGVEGGLNAIPLQAFKKWLSLRKIKEFISETKSQNSQGDSR